MERLCVYVCKKKKDFKKYMNKKMYTKSTMLIKIVEAEQKGQSSN